MQWNGATSHNEQLRELAQGALRRAARAVRPEDTVDMRAREMIRQACEVARDFGLPAEQLLLVLKEAWWELPEARRLPRLDAGDVLAQAITVCIHEYYAPGRVHE